MKYDSKQIQQHYIHIKGTGTRTLSTTFSTAILDTVITNSSTLFTESNGVITYNGNPGTVLVTCSASGDSGSNTRSVMKTILLINGITNPDTERYSYHRQTNDGEGSSSYIGIFPINTGDTFAMQNAEVSTGDDIIQDLQRSNLQLKLI